MKKLTLFFIFFIFTFIPVYANDNIIGNIFSSKDGIFTYHIPDDQEENSEKPISEDSEKTKQDIISDDVTADTSGNISPTDDDIEENDEDYNISDIYSFVLKGYAEYNEEDENSIFLDIDNTKLLTLNIKQPVAIGEKYFGNLKPSDSLFNNNYTMYNGSEYSIKPLSGKTSKTVGNWSAGTTYSQGIDYGELEQSSAVFSKYQYKNFAISTSYAKTINTTNNNYNDNFYLTPELKLNQYFTIKNILSVDTVKKRKKAEVILSINPFGNKDVDKFRFELGVNETYDEVNNSLKNQFKFSTNFRF